MSRRGKAVSEVGGQHVGYSGGAMGWDSLSKLPTTRLLELVSSCDEWSCGGQVSSAGKCCTGWDEQY